MRWVRPFSEIRIDDVPVVGGKNASLGEMTGKLGSIGVRVPEGYAVTADAYRYFLRANDLEAPIAEATATLERGDVEGLGRTSRSIQNSVMGVEFPEDLETEILRGYRELSSHYGEDFTDVAVRSSATAEDLPTASFAGQQESFLNVHGDAQLLDSVKRMCAALIEESHRAGRRVGICGQAPSDYPDFATFLVERGIDSVSLSPDAVVPTTLKILEVEGSAAEAAHMAAEGREDRR